MRNDDDDYVGQLERALQAAEREIKCLEDELRDKDRLAAEIQDQLAPTRMGEPIIPEISACACAWPEKTKPYRFCPWCGNELGKS